MARSRLAAVEFERDEWRRRAESATRPRTRTEYVVRRAPLGTRVLAAMWLLVLGVLVGGAAIPHANDAPTLRKDYGLCIATARDKPSTDGAYGALMNALHVCGVYDADAPSQAS